MANYFTKALGIVTRTEKRHVDNVLNSILYGNLVGFKDVVFYNYNIEDYIKKGYKGNAEVYSIVKKIVNKCLVAPLYLYEDKEDVKSVKFKRGKMSKNKLEINKRNIYVAKSLEFSTHAKDLQKLLAKPNEKQTWRELNELFDIFYFTQGEAFLYRETAEDSDIALSLHVAPANLMTPVYGGGDVNNAITGWKINLLNGYDRELDVKDVLQLKMPNPEFDSMGSQDRGMSPLEAGQKYLQLNDSALKAWINSEENEGAKGLISPNHADPKLWLQPEQVLKTQEAVDNKINGGENKNRVVTIGMPVQYQSMALSPTALGVIEALKHSGFRISLLWNVSPVLFDQNPIQHNLEEAKLSLVTDVVIPYESMKEDALNEWLIEPFRERDKRNYVVNYDVSVYTELKLSLDERKALSEMLSINEMRVLEGWDELPEESANQVFVQAGKVPLSEYDMGYLLNDDTLKHIPIDDYKPVAKAEISKGCLMFYPDIDINEWVNGIRKLVPNHIVEEYEYEPHLTILYGFDDSKMNVGRLKYVVNDFIRDNPVSIRAYRIGVFSNDNDVIKINVEDLNGNLTRLNSLVKAQFAYENDYPDYKPHLTIAYVNKGAGAYLDGSLIDLKDYGLKDLNTGIIKYSDRSKNKTVI